MKKVIHDALLPILFTIVSIGYMACTDDHPNTIKSSCYLHEELAGGRFSVYYMGESEPLLKGDLNISKDLSTWQYADDSDSQRHVGNCFENGTGRMFVNDHDLCQEESYAMRFVSFNKKQFRDFKLIKRNIDDRFGVPIFSYLFETINPKSGKKEYYQFNKE